MAVGRMEKAVPFPEFAPDHVLRFTWADMIALELAAYGISAEELEREHARGEMRPAWTRVIEQKFAANDTKLVRQAIKLALKKPGGIDRPTITDNDLNDLPFSPAEVIQKVADALACAITGRAYATMQEERRAAEEAAKAAA